MNKKLLFFIASVLIGCSSTDEGREAVRRSLFVSMIQEPQVLSSQNSIENLIEFSKRSKIKTLFIQVYRANQAWFPSEIADSSLYKESLKNFSEDPFKVLIKKAHSSGIQVHAWLNLLSLSANQDAPILKKYGPSILTRNLIDKKSIEDYQIDNQYFLEPGDPRVSEALSIVVREVVGRYPDLDGIQFDYIRHPDKDPFYGYTEMNLTRFKASTGLDRFEESNPLWKKWKRDQVTTLVRTLKTEARKIHPKIQVSVTGLMPYSRALREGFQDWRSWLDTGLVDFVTLMSYTDKPDRFRTYLKDARKQLNVLGRVNIAVGAYAFLKDPESFRAEWELCEAAGARSCAALHYGSFVENPDLAEAFN